MITMPSQSDFTMTLQVVHDLIASRDDLPDRAELRSGITRLGKIANLTLSNTPADGPAIRAAFAGASWQLAGLSKRSWENIKWRVRRAMRLVGVNLHRRRQYRPSPDWAAVIDKCGADARHGLTRFGGWCTIQGIAPNDVNTETFDQYVHYLIQHSSVANPRERWHVARRAWNVFVANVATASFQQIPNNEPDGWRGLPLSAFPVGFQAGIKAWRAHMVNSDQFARTKFEDRLKTGKVRKALKPTTADNYIASLRQSASRLIQAGSRLEEFDSLQVLADPEIVRNGLRHLVGNREVDNARPALHALMTATLNLAAYLDVKGEHLEELKWLAREVRHRPRGMCERNKSRLQPFKDKEVLRRLICLPPEIAKRLDDVKSPTIAEAQLMQMAVLLELLLHVPMRVKNAASLDFDKHFQRPPGGKPGPWRINVQKAEVKNDKAIDAEFSVSTSAFFARYEAVFRPVLATGKSTALFLSRNGQRKGPSALSKQFCKFIRRELGLTVNIHLMRHLAAFAFLDANPGDYEGVRQLLGHKQITTTVNIYCGAESAAAFRRLDRLVDKMRDVVLNEETGLPMDFESADVL
jgi:site-specific recombinase XerD